MPVIALLLAACQSTSAPAPVDLDQQLRSRALAFATAMEARDTVGAIAYTAPSARGFFEAQMEIEKMQWGEHDPREPADVAVKSASHDGNRGVAIVTMSRDGQGRDLTLYFDLENRVWGAVGFRVDESSDMQLFADRESKLRETIARAVEETTPHAELGAFVTAYLAAGANKDKALMTANMTAECAKQEERKNSFTSGFLAGRFKVNRWQFARHEVDGDTATQHVRTLLELPGGETDNEPMGFSFEQTAAGWVITGIR